jgi:predicted metal-binding membrane protein
LSVPPLALLLAVMMVAMMTPSAAPMILMFAAVNRRRGKQEVSYVPASVFLAGYLVVWATFSVIATAAQWGLHSASLLSPMMASTSPILGGTLLVAAGTYQWTPLKHACLSKCRDSDDEPVSELQPLHTAMTSARARAIVSIRRIEILLIGDCCCVGSPSAEERPSRAPPRLARSPSQQDRRGSLAIVRESETTSSQELAVLNRFLLFF